MKNPMPYRTGRAPRHITGKHGQQPPFVFDLSKPGRVARWLRTHPLQGKTTPPRTPKHVIERRERWGKARKQVRQ